MEVWFYHTREMKNMHLSKKIWTIMVIAIVTTMLITQTPVVHADKETVQEKVLSALRDVAGIDVDKYTIILDGYWAAPTPGYEERYRGEEEIALTLKSEDSEVSVIAEYLNNCLLYMYTYIEDGSSSDVHYINKLPENSLIATKEALTRLQKFGGNPVISDIQKIVESAKNIDDLNGKTVGNMKCVIHKEPPLMGPDDGKGPVNSIYFMYSINDAESPKSIGIHFNPDGSFKGFHDTWNLYPVGSEVIKVSKEQAIATAREQATVAAESVTLEFPSDRPVIAVLYLEVRENFMLYPFWFVEIPIVYAPDLSIYGWQTGIWADTGEIIFSHPVGGYGVMPDTNSPAAPSQNNDKLLIAGIITTVAIVSLIAAVLVLKKR
jgi:hypothetical protein